MSEKTKVEFLYLSEEDMIEAGVLDAGKCVDVMGEVVSLLSKGDYLMGGKDRNACLSGRKISPGRPEVVWI